MKWEKFVLKLYRRHIINGPEDWKRIIGRDLEQKGSTAKQIVNLYKQAQLVEGVTFSMGSESIGITLGKWAKQNGMDLSVSE